MKNVILLIAFLVLSFNSFADQTGLLNLKGKVLTSCDIIVVPTAASQSLDILNGESLRKVADISQTCNKKEGFKVEATSVGNGRLINTDDPTPIAYQIKYDESSMLSLFSSTPTLVKNVSLLTKKTKVDSEVFISFTGNPEALAGDFVDTITFTISAN